MKNVWDIKPPKRWYKKENTLEYNRRVVNKFFANLTTRGGVVGGKAVLLCYNEKAPELSYIITEQV
jgi:hypothetical protein